MSRALAVAVVASILAAGCCGQDARPASRPFATTGLDAETARALLAAARAARAVGADAAARALAGAASVILPDDVGLKRDLVAAALADGDAVAALNLVERELRTRPFDPDFLVLRARALGACGRFAAAGDALRALRRAGVLTDDGRRLLDASERPQSRPAPASRRVGDAEEARPADDPVDRFLRAEARNRSEATLFVLRGAELLREGEAAPLGGAAASVRLRALRVASGSSSAVLSLAGDVVGAEDLRRAFDALEGAGFVRISVR